MSSCYKDINIDVLPLLALHNNSPIDNSGHENNNLVDKFMRTLACKGNIRNISIDRLTCANEDGNIVSKIVTSSKGQSDLLQSAFYLFLTGCQEVGSRQNSQQNEDGAPLTPIALTPASNTEPIHFIATPLKIEDILKTLRLLGNNTQLQDATSIQDLMKEYLNELSSKLPKSPCLLNNTGGEDFLPNYRASLIEFVRSYMMPHIRDNLRKGENFWWGGDIISEYLNDDNGAVTLDDSVRTLRRFIHENWAKISGIIGTFFDGQHRVTAFDHALCGVDPSSELFGDSLLAAKLLSYCKFGYRENPTDEFVPPIPRRALLIFSIPESVDSETLSQFVDQSKNILEKSEKSIPHGLFGVLKDVASDLLKHMDEGRLPPLIHAESFRYVTSENVLEEHAEDLEGIYRSDLRDDLFPDDDRLEEMKQNEREDLLMDSWTKLTVRLIFNSMKDRDYLQTYNQEHCMFRKKTANSRRQEIFENANTQEFLEYLTARKFTSDGSRGGKAQKAFPSFLGTVKKATLRSTAYYNILMRGISGSLRHNNTDPFTSLDIEVFQILLWASSTKDLLQMLIEGVSSSCPVVRQESGPFDSDAQVLQIVACCQAVSSTLYHIFVTNGLKKKFDMSIRGALIFEDTWKSLMRHGFDPVTKISGDTIKLVKNQIEEATSSCASSCARKPRQPQNNWLTTLLSLTAFYDYYIELVSKDMSDEDKKQIISDAGRVDEPNHVSYFGEFMETIFWNKKGNEERPCNRCTKFIDKCLKNSDFAKHLESLKPAEEERAEKREEKKEAAIHNATTTMERIPLFMKEVMKNLKVISNMKSGVPDNHDQFVDMSKTGSPPEAKGNFDTITFHTNAYGKLLKKRKRENAVKVKDEDERSGNPYIDDEAQDDDGLECAV